MDTKLQEADRMRKARVSKAAIRRAVLRRAARYRRRAAGLKGAYEYVSNCYLWSLRKMDALENELMLASMQDRTLPVCAECGRRGWLECNEWGRAALSIRESETCCSGIMVDEYISSEED